MILHFLLIQYVDAQTAQQVIGKWISPNSYLIRADRQMASGLYDESIFIIGGSKYPRQVTEYDIRKDMFIDHGSNVLTNDSYGFSQWHTQQKNTIYMIDLAGSSFSVYHMDSKQFVDNWMDIRFNTEVNNSGCLASTKDYLFVTGGWSADVQMLDLNSLQWINGVPQMQQKRQQHSCIVDEVRNELYNIGGYYPSKRLNSVEKIQINNIQQNTWIYIESLTEGISASKAVIFKDYIYVIGGYTPVIEWLDIVHIIDTISGTVTLSTNHLVYESEHATAIVVDAIIYSFGGGPGFFNTWQYNVLETNRSTSNPSSGPTNDPTIEPTTDPTIHPTFYPTIHPTNDPTIYPTNDPTDNSITSTTAFREDTNIMGQVTDTFDTVLIVVVGSILCLCILCVCMTIFIGFYVYVNNNKKATNDRDNDKHKMEDEINMSHLQLPQLPQRTITMTPPGMPLQKSMSSKGYNSLEEGSDNDDGDDGNIVKCITDISIDQAVEGHNEDLLNETLKEVLRMPSIDAKKQLSESNDDLYYNQIDLFDDDKLRGKEKETNKVSKKDETNNATVQGTDNGDV